MRALFLAAEFFQSNTSTFSVCCKVRFKNMYIVLCENSSWSIWVACCIWEHLTARSFLPPEIILLGAWVCFCSLSCLFFVGNWGFFVTTSQVTTYQAEQFSTRGGDQRDKGGIFTVLFQSPCCCHLCSVRDPLRLNEIPSPSPWLLSSRIKPSPCGSIILRWHSVFFSLVRSPIKIFLKLIF